MQKTAEVGCPGVAKTGRHNMAAVNGDYEPWQCLSCGEYVERRDWRPGVVAGRGPRPVTTPMPPPDSRTPSTFPINNFNQ